MKGSSYIFERIDLLEYHLHKISLNRGKLIVILKEFLNLNHLLVIIIGKT